MNRIRPQRAIEDECLRLVREMLVCLDRDSEEGKKIDCLNEWELSFLNDVRKLRTLSTRQSNKVLEIHEKFSEDYSGAPYANRNTEED